MHHRPARDLCDARGSTCCSCSGSWSQVEALLVTALRSPKGAVFSEGIGIPQRGGTHSMSTGKTPVSLDLDDLQSGILHPRPSPYVGTYVLLRIDDRRD